MSKEYDFIELLSKIKSNEIKEGTKIIDEDNNLYIHKGVGVIEDIYEEPITESYNLEDILAMKFKLLEELKEIDIQNIEKLNYIEIMQSVSEKVSREENLKRIDKIETDLFYKVNGIIGNQNTIIQAIKQLDNKIKNT